MSTKDLKNLEDMLEEDMKQTWIINDEWSEYHQQVASFDGWALSHVSGMWEIVARGDKFESDDKAREYVLANEHNPDVAIYALAINAIIMGNMGKI